MRLTIKPGVERACTGTLPQAVDRSKIACATPGAVCKPETTSTSFIKGTGLKKCMPTTRPGFRSPLAMAVIDKDEVLLASTQSPPSRNSSSANKARLASRFSTMASITKPASAASAKLSTGAIRMRTSSTCACVNLPLASSAWRLSLNLAWAWRAAPSRASIRYTLCPACAATCAMPAPMMPAPTTRIFAEDRGAFIGIAITFAV